MKYLKYLLIILAVFACSCEQNMLLTRDDVPNGVYVTLEMENNIIDAADLDGSPITGTFDAPSDNVQSHAISVRRIYNAGTDTSAYIFLETITEFPTDWSITAAEIATAFGISLDDAYGDFYVFDCVATGKDGRVARYENLDGDIVGSSGQLQGFRFTAMYVCPSDPSLIVGTYSSLATGSFPDFGEFTNLPSEVTITETDEEGVYELSDFSFGTYDVYYGPYYTEPLDCTGYISDICGIYFIDNTSDYWGETVSGDFTFNQDGTITVVGGTTYGEEWTVVLTKVL